MKIVAYGHSRVASARFSCNSQQCRMRESATFSSRLHETLYPQPACFNAPQQRLSGNSFLAPGKKFTRADSESPPRNFLAPYFGSAAVPFTANIASDFACVSSGCAPPTASEYLPSRIDRFPCSSTLDSDRGSILIVTSLLAPAANSTVQIRPANGAAHPPAESSDTPRRLHHRPQLPRWLPSRSPSVHRQPSTIQPKASPVRK